MALRGALSVRSVRSVRSAFLGLALVAVAAAAAAPSLAPPRCGELSCGSGECITFIDRCDGVRDCDDGSDEDATMCQQNTVDLPIGGSLTAAISFRTEQRWLEFIVCGESRRNCSKLIVYGVGDGGRLAALNFTGCNAYGRLCSSSLLMVKPGGPSMPMLSTGEYSFVAQRRSGALDVWLTGYSQHNASLAVADGLRLQLQPGIWATDLDVTFSRATAATRSETVLPLRVGSRVVRGPDWEWGDQDGGAGVEGRILGLRADGWVSVLWPNGEDNMYRMGVLGKHDLRVVGNGGRPERPRTTTPAAAEAEESEQGSPEVTESTVSAAATGIVPGSVVVRGPDWVWGVQDGHEGGKGRVLAVDNPLRGWVRVHWESTGQAFNYRMGAHGRFDLREVRRGGAEHPDADVEWITGVGTVGTTTPATDINEVELPDHSPTPTPRPAPARPTVADDDVEWITTTEAPVPAATSNEGAGTVTSGVEAAFRIKPCSLVVRGADWKWGAQDGGPRQGRGREGVALSNVLNNGWVEVRWPNGQRNTYRMGAEGKYDLRLVERDGSAVAVAQSRCLTAQHEGRNWQ